MSASCVSFLRFAWPRALLLVSSTIPLVACAPADAPVEPEPSATAPAPQVNAAVPAALTGSIWRLVAFQSMDDETGETRPENSEAYILELGPDGHFDVQLDCNRGSGTWSAWPADDPASGRITFSAVASTSMRCPPPSLGEKLGTDLSHVGGYLLRDGQLSLSLKADSGIYVWEPQSSAAATADSLEADVRAALQADVGGEMLALASDSGGPLPRFVFREVDLDGDGDPEVLAYLLGPLFCGSGGCELKLLRRIDDAWRVTQSFAITQTPVALGATTENGWRELWRTEAGGGAPSTIVIHHFDGTKYIEAKRSAADLIGADVVFAADTTYESGLLLKP